MLFELKHLSFTLLDLIQLGDIVPHYNSTNLTGVLDHHEVHDRSDSLLISRMNLFEDKYHELRNKLGVADKLDLKYQGARGGIYKKYKMILERPQVADTLVTPENIHEVKVLLTGKFITLENSVSRWTCSAFEILPPYKLAPHLERHTA